LRGGSLAGVLSVSRNNCFGLSLCSFSFTAFVYRLSSRPLTPSLTQNCFRCSGEERSREVEEEAAEEPGVAEEVE